MNECMNEFALQLEPELPLQKVLRKFQKWQFRRELGTKLNRQPGVELTRKLLNSQPTSALRLSPLPPPPAPTKSALATSQSTIFMKRTRMDFQHRRKNTAAARKRGLLVTSAATSVPSC